MTITFSITSKTTPMFPVEVQGTGDNTDMAELCALHRARILRRVERPVVVTAQSERPLALGWRRWVMEQQRVLVHSTPLQGRSSMCFDPKYPTAH